MIRAHPLALAASLALSLGACALFPAGSDATVDAPAGALEGRVESGIRVFRGIPYAMPPVGTARW